MMRPVILAAALASATAFAPTASFAPRLRSARATNMKMAVQPESTVSRAGFLAGLATAAVVVGVSVAPVDASINSQMSMDSNSFSVLTDNQKVYKSTGEEDRRIAQEKGVKKRGNSAATVAVPVVVTSGLSFALLKFLNK